MAAEQASWLTPDERAAWLALVGMAVKLPSALDAQLHADEGLSFFEYMILAVLSERPDRTVQMSEIAELTSASLSRLSHTVTRLEGQGFVRRERIPGAGRRTNAVLTDAGHAKVTAAAPAHVQRVRELVINAVAPEDLAVLRRVGDQVLERINPDRSC